MNRLLLNAFLATATLALALPATTSANAAVPAPVPSIRTWDSSALSAAITSCLSGNSGQIFGIAAQEGNRKLITGYASFCRNDGARSLGLEFFTPAGASGFFIKHDDDFADIVVSIDRDWSQVRAICVSAARNDRLSCKAVHRDGAGNVSLSPIAVTDPVITPSGPMYGCKRKIDDPITDPTCATCV